MVFGRWIGYKFKLGGLNYGEHGIIYDELIQ